MSYRLWLIILLLFPVAILAVPMDDLYSVRVPATGQDPASRNADIRAALRIVLVRLTGNKDILGRPALTALVNNAVHYVLQYHYQQTKVMSHANTALSVLFDEKALNRALQDQDIAIWGRQRPLVLIWLAAEDGQGRNIVDRSAKAGYLDIIDRYTELRGVATIHPLLDLEDTTRITAGDIWAGFNEPIQAASKRYSANIILLGYIRQPTPSHWQVRWTAIIKDQSSSWLTRNTVLERTLHNGIDILIDKLLDHYITAPLPRTAVVPLIVNNITDLGQYARVLSYLESLSPVEQVFVSGIEDDQVRFQLIGTAGDVTIAETISLDTVLRSVTAGARLEFELIK